MEENSENTRTREKSEKKHVWMKKKKKLLQSISWQDELLQITKNKNQNYKVTQYRAGKKYTLHQLMK